MNMEVIKVENLMKYYGNFLAMDNISFSVEEGEGERRSRRFKNSTNDMFVQ